ncbi:MAG: hypothetical protein AMXMBFR84_32600 [Candidatus Hydrogenedentota bacterium]
MKRSIPFLMLVALAVGLGGGLVSSAPEFVLERDDDAERNKALDAMQGKPAPELVVGEWLSGEATTLADLKGSVVMIDFWGVWCGPCRALVPHVKELQAKHADRGLVVIGVHTTHSTEKAAAFIQEQGITYRVPVDKDKQTVTAYHVNGYPDIYLIDHEGILRYADLSNGSTENIDAAVESLLKEREEALAKAK